MAGIYGSDLEDRYFERMLHRHLDDRYDEDEHQRELENAEFYRDMEIEARLINSALKKLEEAETK